MKEVAYDFRVAIIGMLQGITFDGNPVPVWGKVVPPSVDPPYITIPTQSSVDDSAKDIFFTDHTINIEIVVRSMEGGNFGDADLIANDVKQRLYSLRSADYPVIPGFGIVDLKFESDTDLSDYTGSYWYFRKVLTFTAKIQEG